MSATPELWKATYEATTSDGLAEAYKNWVKYYDHDTRKVMGHVGPDVAATMLHNYLDSKQCKVLDAGCGTGLVGDVLNRMGYKNLEAMDYSDDMIAEAQKKGVYGRLFQADMNRNLPVPDDLYDAIICVGTFTYAHVGPEAFDEMMRVTRPGGYVCFTIRDGPYQEYGYRARMLELEAQNNWELVELREEDYLLNEDVTARFFTYKVLDA